MAVVDGDLGDGAEHEAASGREVEDFGQHARDDVEADEAGEAAGASDERECAVGCFDQAACEGNAFGFVGVE